jgi:polysaccharide export outer membrane protein
MKSLRLTAYTILLSLLAIGTYPTESIAQSIGSYQIGSGDVLEIVTWKEPDLSREQIIVRTDGFISFPLLNDVMAAGQTPTELKNVIEKGLAEFVTAPVVTVTIKDSGSKKFYILGEIARTGEYTIYKNLNILQAFALAGGFTQWASKKEIILMRREGGKDRIYRVNYKDIEKGNDLAQNIMIEADDTIIVP